MKALLRKLILGISIPQEYVCLPLSDAKDGFQFFINSGGGVVRKVDHLFLGYAPLVIGVMFGDGEESAASQSEIDLHLRFPGIDFDIGILRLERKIGRRYGSNQVVFYQGKSGYHALISKAHQQVNSWLLTRKPRPDGFIQLTGNGYEQVRIAYAIPRKISLLSLGDATAMNVFPTDLHGSIGSDFYASSLRLNGKACSQVEAHRRVALSDVPLENYREVYAMGKNHQRELAPVENFRLLPARSRVQSIPLPVMASSYQELEVIDSFDQGIHRIFIYRVVNRIKLKDDLQLAHIHNYAMQWRMNRGLKTYFLVR